MQRALLLFTKVPEPGRVKTRLMGADCISATDTSNLYSTILKHTFDMMTHLAQSGGVWLYACYPPRSENARIRESLSTGRGTETLFFPQNEEEATAQRIAGAFDAALGDGCDIDVLAFGDQPKLDDEFLFCQDPLRMGLHNCLELFWHTCCPN